MIYAFAVVPVNPEGEERLTIQQIWKGLELKARDARLFLPPGLCTKSDVVAEGRDYIVREATIMGQDMTEIIAFEPLKKVSFFQQTGPREGVIVNELMEDENGELLLKFYGLLGLRDRAPGGPEEQEEQARLDSKERGYKGALMSTLAQTRELVREGRI